MWNWLFGKKNSQPQTEKNIQSLKEQLSTLEKRENLLQKKFNQEQEKAVDALKTNKNEAVKALKNKKIYEQQLQNIQNQKINIETMISKIEEAIVNADILKSQEKASKTLKELYKGVDINNIDKKLEDIRETFDKANEINQMLSEPIQVVDESEILDELENLESSQIQNVKIPEVDFSVQKETNISSQKEDVEEEEELKKLEMELKF